MKKALTHIAFAMVFLLTPFMSANLGLAADDVVRMGVISPASGNYADIGAAEQRGMTMGVQEFNARGGMLGKKIEMIVEDTGTDPAAAARKAKKLIEPDNANWNECWLSA